MTLLLTLLVLAGLRIEITDGDHTDVIANATDGFHQGQLADVFVDELSYGPVEITFANGNLDRYRGSRDLHFRLRPDDGQGINLDGDITLHDGCGFLVRYGSLEYQPDAELAAWYLRGGDPDPDLIDGPVRNGPQPDIARTATTGSPRNLVDRWPLAVAVLARGRALAPELADMSRWVFEQYRRPALYYHADGELLRARLQRHTTIGPAGIADMWSASDFWGRPKNRYGASGETRWAAFDHGHLEVDRLLLIHAMTGSRAALRAAEAVLEAAMSYPGLRPGHPAVLTYADAQRHYGWMLRALALAHHVHPSWRQRRDYQRSIETICLGLQMASASASGPVRGAAWYLALAQAQTDSMHPGVNGAAWRAYRAALGDAWDPSWDGPIQDPMLWRQVRLWQQAILAHGLGLAIEVGVAPKMAARLHRVALASLVVSSRAEMVDVEAGVGRRPAGLWRCYSPYLQAARPVGSGGRAWPYHWLVPALSQAARMYPGQAAHFEAVRDVCLARASHLETPLMALGILYEADDD